jgi:hypothetical protein
MLHIYIYNIYRTLLMYETNLVSLTEKKELLQNRISQLSMHEIVAPPSDYLTPIKIRP